ncbi:glycosyltransferase family 4 protein [Sphingomonas morindae]|uniref:Glycosyltransferase family 4 protein n=1 Tax=Sphingomonas morindae TaxID=1541170 RepID=A0ABY4X646_9SPHN|nr:glycosyltransferase family 1 protein [Sphingomonas morindae]USI72383.1 glycosyltransferase family 4 protein [Sphingomonas morindae]
MSPAPLRLAVDARMDAAGGTGVSTYTRTVLAAAALRGLTAERIAASGSRGTALRWLRAGVPLPLRLRRRGEGLVARDLFRLAQSRFNRTGAMLELIAPGPPGVAHWAYPVPIFVRGWRNLYTVHDLIPLTHPALTSIDPARHRRLLALVARHAARIVTISEASRRLMLDQLGWSPARVVNAGLAVDVAAAADATLPAGVTPGGYYFFCGRIEPRKNLLRLIEAHAASGATRPLLLAGPPAEGAAPILAAAAAAPGVRLLDYVDRATLLGLVAGARALLFPSLAEGFGLPLAEAMALGTPALISRDPALREVAGEAALVVDEQSVPALADGIARLERDDALCATLVARGRARAEAFRLERFADRLGALYEEVARG